MELESISIPLSAELHSLKAVEVEAEVRALEALEVRQSVERAQH